MRSTHAQRVRVAVALIATCTVGCALLFDVTGFDGAIDASDAPTATDATDAADATDESPAAPVCDGGSYHDMVLCASPVAYWRLGEVDAASAAVNEIDGGLVASYSPTKDGGSCTPTSGALANDPNGAMHFENCRLQFANDIPSFFFGGNTAFSIELWVDYIPCGTNQSMDIVARWLNLPGDAGTAGYAVLFQPALGTVTFERMVGDNVPAMAAYVAPAAFAYFVAAYDGSTVHLYVDGQHKNQAPDTRSLPDAAAPTALAIGAVAQSLGSVGYCGAIDEVAIYRRALTLSEVAAHYHAAGY